MAAARWKSGKIYYEVIAIRHACLSTLGSVSLLGAGGALCARVRPDALLLTTRSSSRL